MYVSASLYDAYLERQRDYLIRLGEKVFGPDQAQDFAQDALLQAYTHLCTYRGAWEMAAVRAWLYPIFQQIVAAYLRRPARAEVSIPADEALAHLSKMDLWHYLKERITDLIRQAGLTPRQQLCIVREMEGETQASTARVLQVNQSTVSREIKKAQAKIEERARKADTFVLAHWHWFWQTSEATVYHKPSQVWEEERTRKKERSRWRRRNRLEQGL